MVVNSCPSQYGLGNLTPSTHMLMSTNLCHNYCKALAFTNNCVIIKLRKNKVLERHLTLDNSWKGSDHMCSLTPSKFKHLVTQIRTVETAMGTGIKVFQPSEQPCYNKLGKTIVAAHTIAAGKDLQLADIKVKVAEPKGCPAENMRDLLGKALNHTVEKDQSISLQDIIL